MKSVLSIAAALCLLFVFPFTLTASPFSGLIVTEISLQDDQGAALKEPGQVADLMMVKTGDVFSPSAISQGISSIYLTGAFSDVRVEGYPHEGGVKLMYTVVPVTLVEDITVKGNRRLATSRIVDALPGARDRELREERFNEYRTNIVTLYQSEGYYGVAVEFTVVPSEKPHRVVLTVHIKEPKRTFIEDVTFSGNTIFSPQKLIKAMKNRPGKALRTDVLFDHDLAAIVDQYTEAGYPAAKPGPVNISFVEDRAFITIHGKEGPKVSVSFSGNTAFSSTYLRRQLLIWSEHDVSDAILDSSIDKVRDLYRQKGYVDAKVSLHKTENPGALDLHFAIEEGRRITVKEIAISGNIHFSARRIREEMSLREPGWFSSSPFRQDLLEGDVDALYGRYLDDGFLSVDVDGKMEILDSGTEARVVIEIIEGPQTRVGAISFEGNNAVGDALLLEKVKLKPGSPFNDRLTEEDRYRVLSAYSERGYLYARVESEQSPSDDVINIRFRITEDQPVTIGRIILRGNQHTRESVLRRELMLKPGDTYDYEKILKSQQRIYRLGYFNQARFEPVNPGEKEYRQDMVLTIEERPAGAVEVGVGYGDLDRARAFLEVSHRNMWRLAHYAGVRFEKSDILTRSILNYQHPWFFGYDLQGKFALNWSDVKHVNTDTRDIYYETRQTAASYGVEKKLDRLKTSLTYAFEDVTNYNVQPGAVLSAQDIGRVRISSLSPAVVWDMRDDIFNPRRGSLHGIVVKKAMHEIGSQADFTKASVQTSWYLPLNSSVIAAVSGRAGLAWAHSETTEIPIHERFYLGGSTTVRGYTQDSVGPIVGGIPTGGSGMWQLNAEVRFMPTDGFGFVLFSDAGRVWLDQQEVLRPPTRASFGAGIRYGTPVGPLRIDYGQKINRRSGETPGELHFNIGHTF